MKSYHKQMKETFDKLDTDVHDWAVGKAAREVWPRERSPKVCQLCGYKPLFYQYWLFNFKRLITIQVGSECVHNWVELKYEIDFTDYFDKLMIKSFKSWLSVFFSEYKNKKYLTGYSKYDRKLSHKMYELVNSDYEENPSKVKRLYTKAQKLGYSLPPQLFGYGVFDKKRGVDTFL